MIGGTAITDAAKDHTRPQPAAAKIRTGFGPATGMASKNTVGKCATA